MFFWGSNISWLLLMLTFIIHYVVIYGLAYFYPGYKHTKHVISILGNPNSPVAPFFNTWLIIFSIIISISAINFHVVYYSISNTFTTIGSILLLIFGISSGFIGGIFNVDENKEFKTRQSIIHGTAEAIGSMSLSLIPLIIAIISYKTNDNITSILSIVFFVLGSIFAILFFLSEKNIFKNPPIDFNGFWQRLLLTCMYMPLIIISLNSLSI